MTPTTDLPLHDIHVPPGVSWWPLAPGWWLLTGITVFLIVSLSLWLRHRRRGRLKRLARKALLEIEQDFSTHQDSQRLASELSRLLRRICLECYPRREVAALHGEGWISFLNHQDQAFTGANAEAIKSAAFRPHLTCDAKDLLHATHRWLKSLPPQVTKAREVK